MHTLFNVVITLIFVWFIPQFVKLLCRIFPSKTEDEEYRLKFISGGPLSTAELSLDEVKQEICNFSNAQKAELEINACRDRLREEHINNIESPSYNYQTGVYYIDIVAELERMGDFIINVSEAVIEENQES